MNLILFEADEIDRPLSRGDPRARHILEVLRRRVGDSFDAGLVNGPRGKATLTGMTAESLHLAFSWGALPPPLPEILVLVGLPRPQTARDILRDATSLGVATLEFVRADKAEVSYGQSTLWSSDEWRQRLIAGAAQAFDTRIPDVRHRASLLEALATLPTHATRLALDNYESAEALGRHDIATQMPVVLAIGPERGWSTRERTALRENGFILVHLGPRVLRTETALIAALSILRSKQGLM